MKVAVSEGAKDSASVERRRTSLNTRFTGHTAHRYSRSPTSIFEGARRNNSGLGHSRTKSVRSSADQSKCPQPSLLYPICFQLNVSEQTSL